MHRSRAGGASSTSVAGVMASVVHRQGVTASLDFFFSPQSETRPKLGTSAFRL
jgi:hypothetical protein